MILPEPVARLEGGIRVYIPSATPAVEMKEMSEMKASLRRPVRYRRLMKSSYAISWNFTGV